MKKLLTLVLSASVGIATAQTMYPGNISGCIGQWSFNVDDGNPNILRDFSGNSNSGVPYNISSTSGWRGGINQAGKFDGTTSYGLVRDTTSLRPQTFTMAALVKFDGFYAGNCQQSSFMSKGWPHNISGQYGFCVTDGFYDQSCGTYSPTKFQMSSYTTSVAYTPPTGNFVDTSGWYFMAVTFESGSVKFYQTVMDLNNYHSSISPIHSETKPSFQIGTNSQPLSIGTHMDPSFRYWFNGSMDELVLFNRALSDVEIQGVYSHLYGPVANSVGDEPSISDQIMIEKEGENIKIGTLSNNDIEDVIVYNVAGQILAHPQVAGSSVVINLTGFASQLVVVQVETKQGVIRKKFSVF